ncbi:MAG: hypothetical protein EOO59_06180 [Hymenobacter sp.]|nr:MAG: hypothetical protein EOO59_06180 [Hymenobacter sp.]
MSIYERQGERSRYLLTAERLLSLPRKEPRSAAFFSKLARMYSQVDPARAKSLWERAAAAPSEPSVPRLAPQPVAAAAPVGAEELESLQARLDAEPQNLDLLRRLADVHALDEARWPQATALYTRLLQCAPEDVEVLRLLARLHGQQGDAERAYCYYACLLCVVAQDSEASRFVASCRAARGSALPASQHLTPQAYGKLLAQVAVAEQSGPLEELLAPLARYAELAHPANALRDGELQRQSLVPADAPRLQALRPILALQSHPTARLPLRLWGAPRACEVHLGAAAPTLLLGRTLLAEETDQGSVPAGLFSLARAVELYRSGHTLCARLPAAELGALAAALCQALGALPPEAAASAALGPQGEQWATRLAPLLSSHIRQSMAPKAHAYVAQAAQLDVAGWAQAALFTANRLAMLLCCDVQEATSTLAESPPPRRLDRAAAAQLLRAQCLDLLRFAQSDTYFALRDSLGLQLPRSR